MLSVILSRLSILLDIIKHFPYSKRVLILILIIGILISISNKQLIIKYFMDYYRKTENKLKYDSQVIPVIEETVKEIADITKSKNGDINQFAVTIIHWEKQPNGLDLKGDYLYVYGYDKELNKPASVIDKLSINKDTISYNRSMSMYLLKNTWVNGKIFYQDTKTYTNEAGDQVPYTFKNYENIITDTDNITRMAITYINETSKIKATRFVFMLSKEAGEIIKNPQQYTKLKKALEKLVENYVANVEGY